VAACSSSDDKASSTTTTTSTTTTGAEAASTTSAVSGESAGLRTSLPERGDGPLRVVIDTDAANEIDDQFALALALLAPERLKIEAITAAPFAFGNYLSSLLAVQEQRGGGPLTPFESLAVSMGADQIRALEDASGPAEGMNASLAEIERVVAAAAPASRPQVIAGSESYLPGPTEPVPSAAADFIVEAANSSDEPLYVAVLGAPTNVASALLMDPSIGEKLVVIFVAGFPSASTQVDESFNLLQDLDASRVLFEKCPNLLYIPGYQVAEVLTVSLPEIERYVAGRGAMGDLLAELFAAKVGSGAAESPGARRVMWDMAPIAWLIDPSWVSTTVAPRGQIGTDHRWSPIDGEMVEAYQINDVSVYSDLFARLAGS